MKKLYRTTSIVGFSLMSVPLLFIFQYIAQPSHILYLGGAAASFLFACILLSFDIMNAVRLNNLKRNGRSFPLKVISLQPIKLLHVRGFYTFKLISEYDDDSGVRHNLCTPAYSVLDFRFGSQPKCHYLDDLKVNIYFRDRVRCLEVTYDPNK